MLHKLFLVWMGMISVLSFSTARADVRSHDPNDPYRIHFEPVNDADGTPLLAMDLCDATHCRLLGTIQVAAEEQELKNLQEFENTLYWTKYIGNKAVLYVGPLAAGIKGILEVRVVTGVADKYLPNLMSILYTKFGRDMTFRVLAGLNGVFDAGKFLYFGRKVANKWLNPEIDLVSQKIFSSKVIDSSKDLYVDFSIQDLAEHLTDSLKWEEWRGSEN